MHGGLSFPSRNTPGLPHLAYHTANTATLSGVKCVVIVGGVSFKGQSIPSERLPINELLILKVHDTMEHEYNVDKITATVSVDILFPITV